MNHSIMLRDLIDDQPKAKQGLRQWHVPDSSSEIGDGQVYETSTANKASAHTPYACFVGWKVKDMDMVGPTTVIAELMIDGTPVTVESDMHGQITGMVDWKEGDIIHPNSFLANIERDPDQFAGLRPRKGRGLVPMRELKASRLG